jgi:hypothetical protein
MEPYLAARLRHPADVPPDVSESGHCVTQASRLPSCLTEGEPPYDQRSQGASALVRGAVGEPPVRIRVLGPRAESRQILRPRHPTPALTRAVRPAGTAASQVGPEGTKQLLAQYGERLICVRYRYDAQRRKRFKTVELVVAEREWEPPPPRFALDQMVGLRVAVGNWHSGRGSSGRRRLTTASRRRAATRPAPHAERWAD